jgi:formamidopyrimidine-DNA glycosylase
MPELPDVEAFRRVAEPCVGHDILRAVVSDPGILESLSPAALQKRVKGARVGAVRRHGKHLFVDLSGNGSLAMHFGTNGSLRRLSEKEPDPPYVRLSLVFADGGRLFMADTKLGPDALDRRFDLEAMVKLVGERKRDIKSILMDQQLVAGIGNIYSDEILFQARIYPGTKTDALDRAQIEHIFAALKHVLKTAVNRSAGSETGAERLPGDFLLRERHAGGHCPRCGTALATLKHSGRTAYYCPRCQRRP